MSNVVTLHRPRRPSLAQRQAELLRAFAQDRRAAEDVFWLKENAEILNVLANSGARLQPHDLEVHRRFYDSLEERMRFFPQYYRFLLSICLDLEDLGMEGETGARLCDRVVEMNLAGGELSDLQRAEALRLLARRDRAQPDPALDARLRAFIAQSDTFALPNKKAAYELTHILFYLSDYGNRPLTLCNGAHTSLEYTGLLAYLDQDVDLLAEVCVAMRFAGLTPSDIWEDWLALQLTGFSLVPAAGGAVNDAYHEYLVTSWWAGLAGMEGFRGTPPEKGVEVVRAHVGTGPLRALSEVMFQLGPSRSGDWDRMRPLLERSIPAEHHHIIEGAAESSDLFPEFFEGFARAK